MQGVDSSGEDEGCGDDEHDGSKCGDHDNAPLRYSSGRVESNLITLFQLPGPDDLFFGFRIQWGSHIVRLPARPKGSETEPVIHDAEEATHFFGRGWVDDYSDRLFISIKNQPSGQITWFSRRGTVVFRLATGWKSDGGRYELIDRGPSPSDGFGRWVVRTTDPLAPRQIWAFEEHTFTAYSAPPNTYTLGRLRRRAVLTTNLSDLNGRFGFTINWATNGTITSVVDTLQRELQFVYASFTDGSVTRVRALSTIKYKAAAAATAVDVVTLQMTPDRLRLDRVAKVGGAGYTRFLYRPYSAECSTSPVCGALLSDVIIPGDTSQCPVVPSSCPAVQEAVRLSEITVEHNEYGTNSAGIPRGTRTRFPGRAYGYEYLGAPDNKTIQYDMHQQRGNCGSCLSGSTCYATSVGGDGKCYVSNESTHDAQTQKALTFFPIGSNGNNASYSRNYRGPLEGPALGSLKFVTNAANVRSTFGTDTLGRIRCIVHGDDNEEAFATPATPDTSACAGPSTAQIVRVDYTGPCTDGFANCTLKTTPSLLSGNVTSETDLDATTLLTVRTKVTGKTRDIAGTQLDQVHATTTTYDSIGRLTEQNGPLVDSFALDKVTRSYYTTFASGWPNNLGRLYEETRYVGTSGSNQAHTVRYEEYDVFGVPHKVTGPNGDFATYTPSSDRLTWTIVQKGSDGSTVGTSTLVLNANGTVRKSVDADGVCLTFEYMDTEVSGEYVGAPTRIKRTTSTDAACGVVPIADGSGEVEVRTYFASEADRLKSITQKTGGLPEFTYSFAAADYDRDRRLVTAPTINSAQKYELIYTDVLQTGVKAPGGPAAGTWETTTTVDAHARPLALTRYLDATNYQNYTFTYSSPFGPRPTQLTRGYNGGATATTTFVYDDFGRLVETTVPESGWSGSPNPTRYEYDVADRLSKKRVGINSSLVRTSEYVYDSLGRTLSVNHDTEHGVDCATAPIGTPIEDEEYRYDDCAGDAPTGFGCTNAKGRLTIARTIVQCGTSGQVVKRGRWYDYDTVGRTARIAYATVTGSTIGTPAIMDYSYSAAGRVSQYRSPLNSAFGTKYTRSSTDGRITAAEESLSSGAAMIANGINYRAFGPMKDISTASVSNIGGVIRTLQRKPVYRSDNSLQTMDWSYNRTSGGAGTPTKMIVQTLGYNAEGLITQRTDAANINSSRYYGYDALLRLLCEAKGTSGVGGGQPSASSCDVASPQLVGLFTYGNGQSSTAPPDARMSYFVQSGYVSPGLAPEVAAYSSGSSQLGGVARGDATSLVVSHDQLGRRIGDYDSVDWPRSLREYTYLPNGQLGEIKARDTSNTLQTTTIRYDERGRPITIVRYDSYELFWDDADRLIAVQITFGHCRFTTPCGTTPGNWTSARWHYHYVNDTLVAATRELDDSSFGFEVKRFWASTDERGLVYFLTDSVGGNAWSARWDATGKRTVITSTPEMWVPFGLRGQIILSQTTITSGYTGPTVWGTEAANSVPSRVRPPLAVNQWRVHDPLLGAFLQPDGADQGGRFAPEGYVYGRNRPVQAFDTTGSTTSSNSDADASVWEWGYDIVCDDKDYQTVAAAINVAYLAILFCDKMSCSNEDRREWLNTILSQKVTCVRKQSDLPCNGWAQLVGKCSYLSKDTGWIGDAGAISHWDARGGWVDTEMYWHVWMPPFPLDNARITSRAMPCLAKEIAHEAFHRTADRRKKSDEDEEADVKNTVAPCFMGKC